ncbi:MAG: hypothetical protein ACR2RV_19605 [Verrucomicrobiales bacterium]
MQTLDSAASIEVGGDPSTFLRVVGQDPVQGSHLGQLRVDEGEFGTPLARHRLKSLWDFYLPTGTIPSDVPVEYFQQLILRLVYREGEALEVFTGKLDELPGAEITVGDQEMIVTWGVGTGDGRRDYELELDFRYDIGVGRKEIHLSDPQYSLACEYATAQPEAGYDNGLVIVPSRVDEVSLYQLAANEQPRWFHRDVLVEVGPTSFDLDYYLGVPMLEGSPAFIWKTPILDRWASATNITGLTSVPLEVSDRFARTYEPGHHNFVETFWIEPALIPGLNKTLREELQVADIRFIVLTNPFSFPETDPSAKLVGFDLEVRDL